MAYDRPGLSDKKSGNKAISLGQDHRQTRFVLGIDPNTQLVGRMWPGSRAGQKNPGV
jgi:hypothetical protein